MKKKSRFLQTPIEPFMVETWPEGGRARRADGANLVSGPQSRDRASRLAQDARRRRDDFSRHGRSAERRRPAPGRRSSHRQSLRRLPRLDRRQPVSRPARDARAAALHRIGRMPTTRRSPRTGSIASTTPTRARKSSSATTTGSPTSRSPSSRAPTPRGSSSTCWAATCGRRPAATAS